MPRRFRLPEQLRSRQVWKDPRILVRIGLGVLLLANLIAAAFAFHWLGESPEALTQRLSAARAQLKSIQTRRDQSKVIAAHMDQAKGEGDQFLETWITGRRHTYSSIIGEITQSAKASGMKMLETSIAPLDPIEGSSNLELMTITVNFEGGYPQLLKLVNAIDRSPKLFIIDSLTVAPQPRTDLLNVSLKLNTVVKEDVDAGAL